MILNYDSNYFMQKAIDEAKFGLNKGEVPVGAVIVIDNKIHCFRAKQFFVKL